jgi:hypothetical protein
MRGIFPLIFRISTLQFTVQYISQHMRKGIKCAKCFAIYEEMSPQTRLCTAANSFQIFHIFRQTGRSEQTEADQKTGYQTEDRLDRQIRGQATYTGRQAAGRLMQARSGKEAGRYSHFKQAGRGQADAGKIWIGDRKV